MSGVELVWDGRAELGEGPVWDRRTRELLWVEINAGVVHRFDPRSRLDRALAVGQPVGAVCPRAAGGFVIAVRDGIAALSDAGEVTLISDVERELASNRFNDSRMRPGGPLLRRDDAIRRAPGRGALPDPVPTIQSPRSSRGSGSRTASAGALTARRCT